MSAFVISACGLPALLACEAALESADSDVKWKNPKLEIRKSKFGAGRKLEIENGNSKVVRLMRVFSTQRAQKERKAEVPFGGVIARRQDVIFGIEPKDDINFASRGFLAENIYTCENKQPHEASEARKEEAFPCKRVRIRS